MRIFVAACLSGAMGLIACRRERNETPPSQTNHSPPASAGEHNDEPAHDSLPKRVRLDPAVVTDAKIKTAPVTREKLAATIDLPGEVASDPDRTARLSSPAAGRIDSVRFKEGQAVKKGDVLAVIKVPDLAKTKAAFGATAARAAAARANATRLEALAEQRLAAQQELAGAQAEANALEAEAHAAEEHLRAIGVATGSVVGSELVLRAPFAGIIVSRDAVIGQPVTAEETIATIADLGNVWFLARVFEKSLGQIRIGAPATVELNAYPEERFVTEVGYIGKQIDPIARTVTARIPLENRGGLLRLGLFGIARVGTAEASSHAPNLVVPRGALTDIGKKHVVFVREPDGDFDVHEVVPGEEALGKVEILSGLREGESVVVEGVFTLKSVVLKGTFGEEE